MTPADAVWAMIEQLPTRGQVELHRRLQAHRHTTPLATDNMLQQLGCLARLLPEHGEDLGGSPRLSERITPELPAHTARRICATYTWRVMPRERYDALRDPGAPPASSLVRKYGRWIDVCRAADGLMPDGRYRGVGRPWPNPTRSDGIQRLYEDADCVRAVRRCAVALGRVPSCHDYIQWRRAHFAAHPTAQRRQVALPTYDVIKQRFGSWSMLRDALRMTDVEIRAARNSWMPTARPAVRSLADRLDDLDAHDLAAIGLTNSATARIARSGAGHLPITTALALARALDVDLAFCAGNSSDPQSPECGEFDGTLLATTRKHRGIWEAALLRAMKLTRSEWVRACRNRHELTLHQVLAAAACLGISPQALLQHDIT